MAVAPGTRIGPYEVVGLLGAGGMGEVCRASDPRLGRDVAGKVLPEATRASPELRTRFEREATLLASINHPNIATIPGLEDVDGSAAIVMELVDGPSLADLIVRGPLGLAETARTAHQIADGMSSAPRASGDTKSIVVQPFANLSPDPDTEYFSDGLTDEIITDLSRVQALRVISRSSAMRLKGGARDLAAIGRHLGCRYVLEGSARRATASVHASWPRCTPSSAHRRRQSWHRP